MNALVVRGLVVLALLGTGFGVGWLTRGWKADADQLESLQDSFERIADSDRAAARADFALLKTLRERPAAGRRIREIVREHPVDCTVPEPVARGLRDALDRANAAAQ